MYSLSRAHADRAIVGKREVWGTGLSTKITDGVDTRQPCLTVYVSNKLNRSTLSKTDDLIPKTVFIDGVELPTDVIRLGQRTVYQLNEPVEIIDDNSFGTMSFFAEINEELFGVTCAHCVWGKDKKFDTLVDIRYRKISSKDWGLAGSSNTNAYFHDGVGNQYDFGFADAAVIRIEAQELIDELTSNGYAAHIYPIPSDSLERAMLSGANVKAWSTFGYELEATVAGVNVRNSNNGALYDIVIKSPDNGRLTRKGDSGLAWYTENLELLCVHSRTKPLHSNPNYGHVSYCMWAERIKEFFDLSPIVL